MVGLQHQPLSKLRYNEFNPMLHNVCQFSYSQAYSPVMKHHKRTSSMHIINIYKKRFEI